MARCQSDVARDCRVSDPKHYRKESKVGSTSTEKILARVSGQHTVRTGDGVMVKLDSFDTLRRGVRPRDVLHQVAGVFAPAACRIQVMKKRYGGGDHATSDFSAGAARVPWTGSRSMSCSGSAWARVSPLIFANYKRSHA